MNERKRSREKTKRIFQRIIGKTLARPENLTVSEWAQKYRILDNTSALPGRWSNDVTPYLVEIMNCFNDPYIEHINFVKPTQVGGTETIVNMLGYIIDQQPSPTMIVYPTDELGKDISNGKLKPAFRKSQPLKDKFFEANSKEMDLRFKGMELYIRGAGSPSKLSSKAIRFLFFDEIDKFGGASKKEASPYDLARERTKTFKNSRKIYSCSTPTLKDNYIWKLHEAADEIRHYVVPCPHCEKFIELKWKQVKFNKDEGENLSVEDRANTARYICQECLCIIEDKDKPGMLRRGYWKTMSKKGIGKTSSVSFWLNSLYSIFVTWKDAAKEWLNSKNDPDKLQNFINSWLAEPWEDTKLKTSEDLVIDRQTIVPQFTVPNWAKMLCGGVDVQESSLYWTIRAFGNHITSQNITHGQCLSFGDIEDVMNKEYKREDGEKMIVELCLIDSGNNADEVYNFCIGTSNWALPVKGTSQGIQGHYRLSKVNKTNSKAYGMTLVMCDGGKYKDMIAARMAKENGTGSWMVYDGCDREYAAQVTSEHKINVKNGKKSELRWVPKRSHADNHYLDTEVYCLCAADIRGVRRLHLQDIGEEEEKIIKEERKSSEEQWIKKHETWI